jgi:diguanylate cyclase (GGDEF)-like protein
MKPTAPIGVAALVRHAQWRVTIFSLLAIALLMAVIGLYELREYETRSMDLVARSLAFAGEPAVRFADKPAMRELIDQFAAQAQIAQVAVYDRDGTQWLRYERASTGPVDDLARGFEHWVIDEPATATMGEGPLLLGRVALRSDGRSLLRYMIWTGLALLLSMTLTAIAVYIYSRRVASWLAQPINALASLTREVRNSRSFEHRAEPSRVLEIDGLADDFNSLLSELQHQQTQLEAQHDRLRLANESLKKASRHDPLTGLPNRGYLGEHLSEVIERARRRSAQVGLVFIDMDRFKEINDRHGHAAGDALLVELSTRLRCAIRDSDFVARLGGDEFVIVTSPQVDILEVDLLTERIHAALDRPVKLPDGQEVCVSITMGMAIFPQHAETAAGLIRAADQAMYRAKAMGRGSFATYIPEERRVGRDPTSLKGGLS